jgi:predicted PolB exonuclease-like 3'-5' exonuclease
MNLPNIEKALFLDIETVPQFQTFKESPEVLKDLFKQKFKTKTGDVSSNPSSEEELWEEIWNLKAPLYPEFGKIVCISVGMIFNGKFITKSFFGDNEAELLNNFVNGKLNSQLNDTGGKNSFLCVYNGEIFDLPFISKRLIINGLNVPKIFLYPNFKPWERNFIVDIKNVWKWDVFDGAISLGLLGYSLGVSIHKDEMDGSMVKDVYYLENDLKKISDYCQKDVTLLFNIYSKLLLVNVG